MFRFPMPYTHLVSYGAYDMITYMFTVIRPTCVRQLDNGWLFWEERKMRNLCQSAALWSDSSSVTVRFLQSAVSDVKQKSMGYS